MRKIQTTNVFNFLIKKDKYSDKNCKIFAQLIIYIHHIIKNFNA